MSTTVLWCINLPAPDEHHAAPSEAIARHMEQAHNEAMRAYFAKNPPADAFSRRLHAGCLAVAVPWPWSAEEHAEQLQSFDAAEWGLTEAAATEGGAK